MGLDRSCFSFLFFLLFTPLLSSATSATFISDNVLDAYPAAARHLLQAKKGCPVNFEFLNYTGIISVCKGPHYLPSLCCSSFKEFACPYADMLNDLTNDCASTMFSYINLYGRYPPGLFSSECREGKDGLECPADSPSASVQSSAPRHIVPRSYIFIYAFLVLLFKF